MRYIAAGALCITMFCPCCVALFRIVLFSSHSSSQQLSHLADKHSHGNITWCCGSVMVQGQNSGSEDDMVRKCLTWPIAPPSQPLYSFLRPFLQPACPGSLRQEVLQLQLSAKTPLSYKGNPRLRFTSYHCSLSFTSALSIPTSTIIWPNSPVLVHPGWLYVIHLPLPPCLVICTFTLHPFTPI